MEVTVEVVNENFDSDVFRICFLCSITITDKKNPDNSFTTYDITNYYSPSGLYRVIMELNNSFLFHPSQLRRMIVSDGDMFKPFNIPECLKGLFMPSYPSNMVITDAFSQCLFRVSEDINSYYQTRFFENNSHLKKSPDDMAYIFEACKYFSNFK